MRRDRPELIVLTTLIPAGLYVATKEAAAERQVRIWRWVTEAIQERLDALEATIPPPCS